MTDPTNKDPRNTGAPQNPLPDAASQPDLAQYLQDAAANRAPQGPPSSTAPQYPRHPGASAGPYGTAPQYPDVSAGAHGTGTQYAPNGQQYPPAGPIGFPPGPPEKKRGFPIWAWIVIGVAVIAVIALAVWLIPRMLHTHSGPESGQQAATPTTQPGAPSAPTAPTPEPSPTPTTDVAPGSTVALSDDATIVEPLRFTLTTSWEVYYTDETMQQYLSPGKCQLTLSQDRTNSLDEGSDADATEANMQSYRDFLGATPGVKKTIDVPVDGSYKIQFQYEEMTASDGRSAAFALRTLMNGDAKLGGMIICPPGELTPDVIAQSLGAMALTTQPE